MSVKDRVKSSSATMPKIVQAAEDLAKNLTMARHYIKKEIEIDEDGEGHSSHRVFDPRYLGKTLSLTSIR
jgi:hypothetical protein